MRWSMNAPPLPPLPQVGDLRVRQSFQLLPGVLPLGSPSGPREGRWLETAAVVDIWDRVSFIHDGIGWGEDLFGWRPSHWEK